MGVLMLGLEKTNNSTAAGASGIGSLAFFAIAAILMVVSLIMQIIGYLQTAKDDDSFKTAVYLTVFSLVLIVISAFFPTNRFLSSLSNLVAQLVNIIVSVLTIFGIANIASQLRNTEVVDKCSNLFKVIIAIGVISLLARFFTIFMPSQAANVIVIVLLVVSMILSVVQYILYILLLSKANNMLNK